MRYVSAALAACMTALLVSGASARAQACAEPQSAAARAQRINTRSQRIDALIARMTPAERIQQLRDRAPAVPRLGIPAYNWWNEGLHGLARDGYATVFPQAIGLAATWDADLLQQVGATVGSEARAHFNTRVGANSARYGGLTVWSPNINIFRDPRWGRGQETYGEDPYLTGLLASRFIAGVQGPTRFALQADATPKHFAAHSGPERGRDSFNAVVSAHDLADTYLRAFRTVTTDGHAAAMMCSYNEINGTPTCGSPALLRDTVRARWGFGGYIVSDCDAVGDIAEFHHFVPDAAHAAAVALNAGVDLDCGNTYDSLGAAMQLGLVTEAQIDTALHRLFAARLELGMLQDALGTLQNAACEPYASVGASEIHSAAHAALAERAAEESAVLLRNRSILPRNRSVLPLPAGARIAVFGADADSLKVLEANYHGTAVDPVTPLDGLSRRLHVAAYAQGALLAGGLPAVLPRTALRTGTAADAPEGLTATYFATDDLSGAPVAYGIVPRVDTDIDRVGFVPAQTGARFSTRWSGVFVPPAAGTYTLRIDVERCWDCTAHDSFTLTIDGRSAVVNTGAKGDPDRVTLHLADTAPHALELTYRHTGEDEGVTLEWLPPANALLDEAVATARQADTLVVFAGLSPDLEGEALQVELPGFDGGDRTSLALPATQRALLSRLGALGKPMVLVLMSGSAIALGPDAKAASAIVEAWYPGESGGTALARLLAGDADFSGHLPITFYRSVDDLPPFTDYSMAHRTYRYFGGPVEYPFGFGLSYSAPVYGAVRLQSAHAGAGTSVTVSVPVGNRGTRAITQVAELYVQPPATAGAPHLALAATQRFTLAAGASTVLHFTLTPAQLSTVTPDGHRVLAAGRYTLSVGGGQPASGDARAAIPRMSQASLRVSKTTALPE